ncbi:MAG: NUDIX hydrolase [Cellvibrionales bacterium]|nr:NUDIX hydrolase [Cellvibrionales bacterium]
MFRSFFIFCCFIFLASMQAFSVGLSKGEVKKNANVDGFPDYIKGITNDRIYGLNTKKLDVKDTADAIVFRINDRTRQLEILLIQRAYEPHTDVLCTPGGLKEGHQDVLREFIEETHGVNPNKTLTACEMEEFKEKYILASFDLKPKKKYPYWDARAVDPVNVDATVYFVKSTYQPKASDDAKAAKFYPVEDIIQGDRRLGFVHVEWLYDAFQEAEKQATGAFKRAVRQLNNNENRAKLQKHIKDAQDRNKGLIMLANAKRKYDGQPFLKDADGKPILIPEKASDSDFLQKHYKKVIVLSSLVSVACMTGVVCQYFYNKNKKVINREQG